MKINYGYFRHRFNAHQDPKLQLLVDQMGVQAYGFFYTLLEIYGEHYSKNKEFFEKHQYVEIHKRIISNAWRKRIDSCDKVITKLELSGLLVTTKSPLSCNLVTTKSANTYQLTIPNFLKYFGSYKKTESKKAPIKRKEKEIKEKEIKEPPIAPQGGKASQLRHDLVNQIFLLWNQTLQATNSGLPKTKALNAKRKTQIKSCLAQYKQMATEQDWKNYFTKITQIPFLNGVNDRGWKADFDFVINPNNLLKIVEGRYNHIGTKAQATQARMMNMENPYE